MAVEIQNTTHANARLGDNTSSAYLFSAYNRAHY